MDLDDKKLEALLACCALGDPGALKILFDRLGGYFKAVAYRLTKSVGMSEDVLQDAFVQIWNNADSYNAEKSKPLTWMTSIVRYRALDRVARERKHQQHEWVANDGEAVEQLCGSSDPELDLQNDRMQSHLLDCLQGLTKNNQRSITLAYLEGYSREEIASLMQTKVNTVKSWLRRGAERLRQCLEAKIEPNQ